MKITKEKVIYFLSLNITVEIASFLLLFIFCTSTIKCGKSGCNECVDTIFFTSSHVLLITLFSSMLSLIFYFYAFLKKDKFKINFASIQVALFVFTTFFLVFVVDNFDGIKQDIIKFGNPISQIFLLFLHLDQLASFLLFLRM